MSYFFNEADMSNSWCLKPENNEFKFLRSVKQFCSIYESIEKFDSDNFKCNYENFLLI